MGKSVDRKNQEIHKVIRFRKMLERFHKELEETETLEQAQNVLLEYLVEKKDQSPDVRIFYVAGKVTSDGFEPEKIDKNLALLGERAEYIRKVLQGTVISAADTFDRTLFNRYDSAGATNKDYLNFWKEVLSSGLISDVVMTPDWQSSQGATFEHNLAQEQGLKIHYYEDIIGQP